MINRSGHIMIALAGESGAGKSTTAAMLVERGFRLLMPTRFIRNEAEARFGAPTRAQIQSHAIERQQQHGNACYVEQALAEVPGNWQGDVVVDSVRNTEELDRLSRFAQERSWAFAMIAIVSSEINRFSRVTQRNRQGDPTSRRDFQRDDQRARGGDSSGFQDNARLIAESKWTLDNNGDLAELKMVLESIVSELRG